MKKTSVISAIRSLILDDGYKSFDSLPDAERDELLALYVIDMGQYGHEVISEPLNSSKTLDGLINYLFIGTPDSAERLANTMRNNVADYLNSTIVRIFESIYEDVKSEINIDAGLKPITDHVTGETRWIK